jgi:hypothetical protein
LSPSFRCSTASTARGESQAGTASTVRSFLLVEDPGPWGVDAVSDSRLPAEVKVEIAARAGRAGVRVLMIRRHGRSSPGGLTVFAAYAAVARPWVETCTVDGPASLLDIDLDRLGRGQSPGLTVHDSPLFLVCTHGRHDVCCAERGRPVAAALQAHLPEQTWEVSHIGGDRFAGNLLVLPDGLYYGRVEPEAAVPLAKGHLAGTLDLAHLRGRCGYPFPVQAAEIFLREEIGQVRTDALTLVSRVRSGTTTVAVFTDGERSWQVEVRSDPESRQQLTCRAARPNGAAAHSLVAITTSPVV